MGQLHTHSKVQETLRDNVKAIKGQCKNDVKECCETLSSRCEMADVPMNSS